MEKTTLINANGRQYEREIPKICITTPFNPIALKNLKNQTGIDFKEDRFGNQTGQPQSWEQFAKLFMSCDWLTYDDGNIIYLRWNNTPVGYQLYYKREGKEYVGVKGCR